MIELLRAHGITGGDVRGDVGKPDFVSSRASRCVCRSASGTVSPLQVLLHAKDSLEFWLRFEETVLVIGSHRTLRKARGKV